MQANLTLVDSYSDALFGAARKAGALDDIAVQITQLLDLVRGERRFRTFMEAPNIPRERKEAIVQKIFGGVYHELLVNFIRMLVRWGRLELFFPALEGFHALYRKHKGITAAKVTSAAELDEDQKRQLEKALSDYMNLRLEVDYRVDEKVIGGLRFLCGDQLIDSTLSSKLDRLRHDLMKTRVY